MRPAPQLDTQGHEAPSCVRFRLGGRGFGIPLSQVREIAQAGAVSAVPLAPAVVRGITPLRGQPITLLDAGVIFDLALPAARSAEDRLMVVFDAPYRHLGLYVHAPVEIGRATVERGAPAAALHPMVMVAAAGGRHRTEPPRAGGAIPAEEDPDPGALVHLVTASELVAFCDARVLEGFRRKL